MRDGANLEGEGDGEGVGVGVTVNLLQEGVEVGVVRVRFRVGVLAGGGGVEESLSICFAIVEAVGMA